MKIDPVNQPIRIENKNTSLRIFNSNILEYFTRAYPKTIVYVYAPIIFYLSFISLRYGTANFFIEFSMGVFLWTFIEYLMHRFIFHFQPKNKHLKKIFFFIHEIHHVYPKDSSRLVTPPVLSLPLVFLVGIVYRIIFGNFFLSFLAGTLSFYVIYEICHYQIHHYNFRNPLARYLKRYHYAHHFMNNKNYFGVTSPFWDYIFKTKPPMPQRAFNKNIESKRI